MIYIIEYALAGNYEPYNDLTVHDKVGKVRAYSDKEKVAHVIRGLKSRYSGCDFRAVPYQRVDEREKD